MKMVSISEKNNDFENNVNSKGLFIIDVVLGEALIENSILIREMEDFFKLFVESNTIVTRFEFYASKEEFLITNEQMEDVESIYLSKLKPLVKKRNKEVESYNFQNPITTIYSYFVNGFKFDYSIHADFDYTESDEMLDRFIDKIIDENPNLEKESQMLIDEYFKKLCESMVSDDKFPFVTSAKKRSRFITEILGKDENSKEVSFLRSVLGNYEMRERFDEFISIEHMQNKGLYSLKRKGGNGND